MPKRPAEPKSFESALAELEQLVDQMESGSIELELALTHYKRGVELVRYCQSTLEHAEQQIRVLEADGLSPVKPEAHGGHPV